MKKLNFIIIVSIFICFNAKSQMIYDQGAISSSMAGLYVTEVNLSSVNNNIGNLADLENTQVGVNINNRFLMPELTTGSIVFAVPFNKSAVGINYSNFGNQFFQYHSAGICYSMKLGKKLSGGIKLNYHHMDLGDNYGSASIVSGDVGFSAKLSSDLDLGVLIKNPTLSKLADYEDERLPTLFQVGLNYSISDQLSTSIGIEKDIMFPTSIKAAIIYSPLTALKIRGGIGTNPTTAAFGIGTSLKKLHFDMAAQYHQVLGFSPEVSLTYYIK